MPRNMPVRRQTDIYHNMLIFVTEMPPPAGKDIGSKRPLVRWVLNEGVRGLKLMRKDDVHRWRELASPSGLNKALSFGDPREWDKLCML
jgi:hypothetical protein